MDGELLCLKWRDHSTTLFRMLSSVRKKEIYCDATIACDGRFYPVHKFVLSTCSEYFEQMFEVGEQKNLMIVLTDIGCEELETLLDYMYFGEVNVLQSDLATFMRAAERLRIKGLAEPLEPGQGTDRGEKRTSTQKETDWDAKRKRWSDETSLHSGQSAVALDVGEGSLQLKTPPDAVCQKKQVPEQSKSENLSEAFAPVQSVPARCRLRESLSKETSSASGLNTSFGLFTDSDQQEVPPVTQSSQIKVEGFNVKDEPEDWHQTEMSDNASIFSSAEPSVPYLSHAAALPISSSGFPKSDNNENTPGQSVSGSLECPSQPLPGPSTLPLTQNWDNQGLPASVPYKGIASKTINPRKTGRPTSDIWNHYKTEKNNGKNFVICIYCTTQKYGYPNATKMKIHTVKCKKCPENVRKQYMNELAQMVAKAEANKLHYMKPLSPGFESSGFS